MLRIYIAIANAQHLSEHASIYLPFIGYITTRRRESGKIICGKSFICQSSVFQTSYMVGYMLYKDRPGIEDLASIARVFLFLPDINLCFLCTPIISFRLLFVLPTWNCMRQTMFKNQNSLWQTDALVLCARIRVICSEVSPVSRAKATNGSVELKM